MNTEKKALNSYKKIVRTVEYLRKLLRNSQYSLEQHAFDGSPALDKCVNNLDGISNDIAEVFLRRIGEIVTERIRWG